MKLLEDKVIIVTGAGQADGMGFATCRQMAKHGAKIVVSDLARNSEERENLEARAETLRQDGYTAIAIVTDITNPPEITGCVEQVLKTWNRIDVLFNNAGTAIGTGSFTNQGDKEWDISYQVNLKGTANFCKAVIPCMIEQGGGNIINNSSLLGIAAIEEYAAYCASKFGVIGLTKSLAAEYGRHNIRVNAVCPGMILTQMSKQELNTVLRKEGETFEEAKAAAISDVPLGRWGTPEEVANAVVFLASPMASYISGSALEIGGAMPPGL